MRAARWIVFFAAFGAAQPRTARAGNDGAGAPSLGSETAVAGTGPLRPAPTTDATIAEAVRRQIAHYPLYSVFDDVHAVVRNATVTLEGVVTTGLKAVDIVRLAGAVPGVDAVHNLIRTLPSSALDDQLRVAVASHIYGDPLFAVYANRSDPPIHVVVENGEVTLTGTVGSDVERLKAEIDARDVFGVLGVDNDLQIAS